MQYTMRKGLIPFFAALSFSLAGSTFALGIQPESGEVKGPIAYHPNGKGAGHKEPISREKLEAMHAESSAFNGIYYNGGLVMSAPTNNVYYIWYGDWSGHRNTQALLEQFMRGLGGSPLFNINSSYYDYTGQRVKNSVTLAGEAWDWYSQGQNIDDNGVEAIVQNALSQGWVPVDTNASYMVLTSPDVNETSGFGSQFCGWHTSDTMWGYDIKYAFIGDPVTLAPNSCGVRNPSPNGDGGADAMASVIFHELSETVSDPDMDGWHNANEVENGDLCAWNFGRTYYTRNGAIANQYIGGRYWLLQQLWVNANRGYCGQSY